jgi:hypothetical protein
MQPALQEQKVIMQIDFLSGTYAMSSTASLIERRLPKILLTEPAASLQVAHIVLKKNSFLKTLNFDLFPRLRLIPKVSHLLSVIIP